MVYVGILVGLACGFLLGEVLDVWYDGRVYYEVETGEVHIVEPTRLYFGQVKYRVQFSLPESYEHYHWGIWLLTISPIAGRFLPYLFQALPLVLVGVALSLILDENRTGVGGHPFGIGKQFARLSLALGILLVAPLVVLYSGLIAPSVDLPTILAGALPFLAMPVIHWLESRGILEKPWP